MSVKVYDTITPASTTFPAVMAEHVNLIREDGTADSIQNLFNNKELGGGGDNSVTLTQEEFELLSDEEKFNGLYYTYDTKRIYKNGIQYGANEPLEFTMDEFKALKEAGALDEKQEYIITTNENGTLLEASDIGYNGTTSGLSSLSVQGAIDEVNDKIDNIIDDENVDENTVLSSKKIMEEIAEVEAALPNIKKFASPSGTAKYITISAHALGDIEIHSAYAGKYMFTSSGSTPVFFGTSVYRGYTLTGWAWNADNTALYLRVNGHMDFVVSAFGSDRVEISDMTTSAPDGITFNATFETNALASEIIGTKTQYRGNQSIDISTSSKLTFIYSSMYASQAGCYMLLSNYNTTPLLIELGKFPQSSFNVTATNKSFGVDTITVTTASDEYSWYVLQF